MLPRSGHLAVKSKIGPIFQRTAHKRASDESTSDSHPGMPVARPLGHVGVSHQQPTFVLAPLCLGLRMCSARVAGACPGGGRLRHPLPGPAKWRDSVFGQHDHVLRHGIVLRVGPKRDALRMARRQQQQPRHAVLQWGQRPRHVVRVVRQLGLGRVRQGELGWVVLGRSVGQRQCAQRKPARPGEDQGQRQRALPRRPCRPRMGVRRFWGRQLLLLRRRDAVGGKQPRQRPVHRRQRRGHPRLRVVGRLGVGRGVRGCVGIHAQLDGV